MQEIGGSDQAFGPDLEPPSPNQCHSAGDDLPSAPSAALRCRVKTAVALQLMILLEKLAGGRLRRARKAFHNRSFALVVGGSAVAADHGIASLSALEVCGVKVRRRAAVARRLLQRHALL